MAIHALRPSRNNENWTNQVYQSLTKGEARFGWSFYNPEDQSSSKDLLQLKKKFREKGWNSFSKDEKTCWQPFLLDIRRDDYVIYINVPENGKCTLAKVTGEYYWKEHTDIPYEYASTGYDANHCIPVDKNSVKTFERNGNSVAPDLRKRLKCRQRHWRVYAEKEFQTLLAHLNNNTQATEK